MSSQPPRFVPTLTEVIQPGPATAKTEELAAGAAVDRAEVENRMVQRVLQRVDLVLERRLREAMGQLILEHAERLTPHLREEIETVVRHSVSQAFAEELECDTKPAEI
jgi:hypothetical protein